MNQIIITNQFGETINNVEEWVIKAPPAHEKHWKDGFSAKELAKYWINSKPTVPKEIGKLLQSISPNAVVKLNSAVAEKKTSFDDFRGGVRNHDLLLSGKIDNTNILVAVEAKVKESFDKIVGKKLEIVNKTENSKIPDRIKSLSLAFWGKEPDDHVKSLRYQLLTALAGTIAEANVQKAKVAVFLVHEFYDKEPNKANSKALEQFIQTFKPEFIISPEPFLIEININQSNDKIDKDIKILIGKVSTKISIEVKNEK